MIRVLMMLVQLIYINKLVDLGHSILFQGFLPEEFRHRTGRLVTVSVTVSP